jgi:hypothetical protein
MYKATDKQGSIKMVLPSLRNDAYNCLYLMIRDLESTGVKIIYQINPSHFQPLDLQDLS